MKYKLSKYKTLTGKKEILEFTEDAYGQWIIYQNKKPMFHINCFDLKNESNQVLNSLLLTRQKSITEVLNTINKNNNTNLSIERARFFEKQVDYEIREFKLSPLPLEWVN